MRVIAGSARGHRLRAVPGDTTRPITDRAKEALFSILQHELPGARVLDLFGGTGAVGIEALSRGAAHCDFIERSGRAVGVINENLAHTGLAERATVRREDAFAVLRRQPEVPYDLIYIAPPQYEGLWRAALSEVDAMPGWLTSDGVAVVQIHPREEEPVELRRLALDDRRTYGGVRLLFYRRQADGDAADDGDAGGAPA